MTIKKIIIQVIIGIFIGSLFSWFICRANAEDDYSDDFELLERYDRPDPPKLYIEINPSPQYNQPIDRVFNTIERQNERERIRQDNNIKYYQERMYKDYLNRHNNKDD